MKKVPEWEKGTAYRDFRRRLVTWARIAGPSVGVENIGAMLLFTAKGRMHSLLNRKSDEELADWHAVLAMLDREYKWTALSELVDEVTDSAPRRRYSFGSFRLSVERLFNFGYSMIVVPGYLQLL